jgi:hypothetical protein
LTSNNLPLHSLITPWLKHLGAPVLRAEAEPGHPCAAARIRFARHSERICMSISLEELHRLGFVPSHRIALDADGFPRFAALTGASSATAPAVYLWMAHAAGADTGEVLYVGKAGKGVARRCLQHQGGFTNSGTGRKNAAALAEILSANAVSVTVMARQADTTELFGQTVSLYATEEDALCARFGPRLNRAAFPEVTGRDQTTPDPDAALEKQLVRMPRPVASQAAASVGDWTRIAALVNGRLRVQDEGTVDDMHAQIEAYGPQDLARLEGLLDILDARMLAPDHALKLIGGYANQLKGCNGITTLSFGRLAGRNVAPNGWVARIYLTTSPRVSFPLEMLKADAREHVETNDHLFAPRDVDAFLRDPGAFLNPDQLR